MEEIKPTTFIDPAIVQQNIVEAGKFWAQELNERVFKQAIISAWPELNLTLDMSLNTMKQKVDHHLMYSEGTSEPKGIV